jgi:hypothetical protein
MLSFSLSGFLGDVLAPRPDAKHEFTLLVRGNHQDKALAVLRKANNRGNTWIDDLDSKGLAPVHVAAGVGALVREI